MSFRLYLTNKKLSYLDVKDYDSKN